MTYHLKHFNCCVNQFFVEGYDELTITELSIGQHCLYFEFTPTGSSQSLHQNKVDFVIHPTSMYVCDILMCLTLNSSILSLSCLCSCY